MDILKDLRYPKVLRNFYTDPFLFSAKVDVVEF